MADRIHFETQDRIGVLTFDQAGSSANVFDRQALDELDQHLEVIESHRELEGLVLLSAKPKIFIAGADISQFTDIEDPAKIRELIIRGQRLFNRIADLELITVAAMHGAAVGGGCEIALACDYRIASPDRSTKIGLPEIKLGILPGWGGCYRLPRLIGLPAALDMILGGKTWVAMKAKKAGLVDLVCAREHFLNEARKLIAQDKPKRRSHWKTNNALLVPFICNKARSLVKKKTLGNYPAPVVAVDVIQRGMSATREVALRQEEDAVAHLVVTPACQNLVQVFFMQERAKKLELDPELPRTTADSVAVIGAGVMGAGIAQWASARGQRVILRDIDAGQLNKGMGLVGGLYDKAVKRRIFSKVEAQQGMDRVVPVERVVPLNVDVVIEAATENMDLKKKIFAGLDACAHDDAILATNTSALSVSELAAVLKNPGRLVGIHFFNPVSVMPLVEVVRGEQTDPAVLAHAVRYVRALGKMPLVVKDSPGFLVNRVLMPYLVEAVRLFEGGADQQQIDRAMLRFGMPMGPLRLIDEVGADVCDHVVQFFQSKFGERIPDSKVLGRMLEEGLLGRKSGKGFYSYTVGSKGDPEPWPKIGELVGSQQYAGIGENELQMRMSGLMVNEAARCLEEGVVETAEQVDFGMIMGTGFAPFLGGPLRYADAAGIANIVQGLEGLAGKEPHFEPCALLRDKALREELFYV